MSYRENQYKFKNAIEVEQYHTARYGAPGQERQKKVKPTSEQMEKRNQYNKEKLARRKMRAHMDVNDYFTTLTFRKDVRPPDMVAAKVCFREFYQTVGKEYRKRGYELKWLRNIEVGTKGAWHIHVVLNRIPDTDLILRNAWKYGKVVSQLLNEKGEFARLAAYITKTEKTDPRLKETSYSTSRNLPVPKPVQKDREHWKTWKDIRIPKGFYLDQDSVREGVNPHTGYEYRCYTLLRVRRI